jgi:hypothetical protein
MSVNSIEYRNNTPIRGKYWGTTFTFKKIKCGSNKYCYIGNVERDDNNYVITHDASTNIVVFRNDDDNIYERWKTASRHHIQDMIPYVI